MNLGSRVWKWLRANSAQIVALAAIVAILGFVTTVLRPLLSRPDLAITSESHDLIFPSSLGRDLTRALPDSVSDLPTDLLAPLGRLNQFLVDTRTLSTVALENNTNETLQNVRIRVAGVRRMTGWAVSGDGLTPEEVESVLENVHHDESARLVLASVGALPPYASLKLHIWGDKPSALYSLDIQPISASYNGGGGELVPTFQVRGADAFVAENLGFLLLILLLVNIAVIAWLYDGLRTRASGD